ncbi:hypothetical protein HOLleu_31645 [Holothuria leucospilota]|uniref:Uncharacterized protein n=1 Tax=Holothuria leucospilota TaxID=206669 RepID=A0A9Q0YTK7_HOLLE|nr:hypothetical protein HOLleu_31645 [Holothuria leucospilota]
MEKGFCPNFRIVHSGRSRKGGCKTTITEQIVHSLSVTQRQHLFRINQFISLHGWISDFL